MNRYLPTHMHLLTHKVYHILDSFLRPTAHTQVGYYNTTEGILDRPKLQLDASSFLPLYILITPTRTFGIPGTRGRIPPIIYRHS